VSSITHRSVDTNGIRMHVAEQGVGPLCPAGISTGLTEGFTLEIPSLGATFVPTTFPGTGFPFGLTVFTTVVEERGSSG
jgi:hypothetical protein